MSEMQERLREECDRTNEECEVVEDGMVKLYPTDESEVFSYGLLEDVMWQCCGYDCEGEF